VDAALQICDRIGVSKLSAQFVLFCEDLPVASRALLPTYSQRKSLLSRSNTNDRRSNRNATESKKERLASKRATLKALRKFLVLK